MANYPKIQAYDGSLQVTDVFGGINNALRIPEGEWSDDMDLTADHYPMLAVRRKRSLAKTYNGSVMALLAKEKLAVLTWNGTAYTLYYGDDIVATFTAPYDRRTYNMLSFGAYIIIPGINAWYNTADGTSGMIDAGFEISSTNLDDAWDAAYPHVLRLSPCDEDGNELNMLDWGDAKRISDVMETATILDKQCLGNADTKTIRMALVEGTPGSSDAVTKWTTVPNKLKVCAVGIGTGFKEGDYITLSGIPKDIVDGVRVNNIAPDETHYPVEMVRNMAKFNDDPNGTFKVHKVMENAIVLDNVFFPAYETMSYTAAGSVKVDRKMPDMDFVVAAQNRLWGCKYGEVDGKMINEIYASELGNFYNWRNYDGTSMASYTASVGTDGPWTGAISYQGKPLFFKETCVHTVHPSAYGAHQIADKLINGVQEGCDMSLCQMDGVVYYMSRDGVCAYDGYYPRIISDALGDVIVTSAFFGAAKQKLYALVTWSEIKDGDGYAELFVYYAKRGMWHKETAGLYSVGTKAAFAQIGESFYFCDRGPSGANGTTSLWDLTGYDGTAESDFSWECTSGLIGWETIEQKYVSLFDLRFILGETSKLTLEIEYDSSGTWEKQAEIHGGGKGSVHIPVRPRRCDHFRIWLHGTGDMALYTIAKRFTKGSDLT